MKVIVLPESRAELVDAAGYYEEQQPGLGWRFWQEVDEHILWVAENATVPRLRPGGYRRVNLKVFPYYVAYLVKEDAVWVLAIGNSHRQPEYWIERKGRAG